jgi:hypothetical protein
MTSEVMTAPTTSTTTPVPPGSVSPTLAQLVIDDAPHPDRPYRREEWPHWDDITGNGCDAREKALIAQATGPVQTGAGCKVVSGTWVSPYDGVTGTDPSSFQIDHMVPLANAHLSGGWQWDVNQRRAFANDPDELVVASAASNQSKSDKPPNVWRPANQGYWCTYASKWLNVKVKYGLTATTPERDALGQMLDTCNGDGGQGGAPAPSPSPAPAAPAAPPTTTGGGVYYANCTAARAAGAAPIHRGDPGYRPALDRDGDGVACE